MSEAPTPAAASADNLPVLFVEDDHNIQRSVAFQLERQGYAVTCCANGEDGLNQALRGAYEVIILDVMLPLVDGLTICRRVRSVFPNVPIIITSARGTDVDKVMGLEVGADDYLSKPFSPAELEARIRAVRRRASGLMEGSGLFRFTRGPMTLDTRQCRVWIGGREAPLTARQFQLLSLLARHPGRVFSRETLQARLWARTFEGERAPDTHICRLRVLLSEYLSRNCIETVRLVGYRFLTPDVGDVLDPAASAGARAGAPAGLAELDPEMISKPEGASAAEAPAAAAAAANDPDVPPAANAAPAGKREERRAGGEKARNPNPPRDFSHLL